MEKAMNGEPIRILLVEDNPGDARLIREMLAEVEGAQLDLECVDRLSAGPERTRISATVVEPLLYRDRLVGVIKANHEEGGRRFTAQDRELLALFAAQAAIAIENARLYEELRQAAIQLEAKVEGRTRELQAVNAQLQEALRRVEEVSHHKSEFLANMSHELRTPLNSVIGFSEVLLDQTVGPLHEKQKRYISHIHTSGKHLLTLIDDILDLSKVEAGRLEFRPETFDLREALEGNLTVVAGLASKKHLALSLEVDERLSTLTADPARFKQILYNLLSNAVKFTPADGTVTVSAPWPHETRPKSEQ